jgi:hypothetical protein
LDSDGNVANALHSGDGAVGRTNGLSVAEPLGFLHAAGDLTHRADFAAETDFAEGDEMGRYLRILEGRSYG